jgi:hypothetical protein
MEVKDTAFTNVTVQKATSLAYAHSSAGDVASKSFKNRLNETSNIFSSNLSIWASAAARTLRSKTTYLNSTTVPFLNMGLPL